MSKGFEALHEGATRRREERLEMPEVPHTCFPAVRLLSNQDKQIISDLCVLGQVSWGTAWQQDPFGGEGNRGFIFKTGPFRREQMAWLAQETKVQNQWPLAGGSLCSLTVLLGWGSPPGTL